MLRTHLGPLVLGAALLAVHTPALAQDAAELAYVPEEPGDREERPSHEGLYLHVRLGMSGFGFFGRDDTGRSRAYGSTIDFGFAIGRAIVPGTMLFLAIDASFLPARMHDATAPIVDANGITGGALGIGVVRYLAGGPTYVGVTLLVEFLSFGGYEGDDPMNVGPFGRLEVGREWEVSEALELGFAGYATFGWAKGLPSNAVPSPLPQLGALVGGLAGTLTFR